MGLALLCLAPLGSACRDKQEGPPIAPRRGRADPGSPREVAALPSVDLWYAVQAGGRHVGARRVTLSIQTTARRRRRPGTATVTFRVDQRILLRVGGREAMHHLVRTERCAPDGTLLHLERLRQRDGTPPRTQRLQRRRGVLRAATGGISFKPPSASTPIVGRCALWLAFLQDQRAKTPRSDRRLHLPDTRSGTVNAGLLTRELRAGTLHYRFADVRDPRTHTRYRMDRSGLPALVQIRGVGMPLELQLSTRSTAEAALRPRAQVPAAALALDVGARLPEPLSLRRVRYTLTLPKALTALERAAFRGPFQRRLPGGSSTSVTLETRRPGALPPALLTRPYPQPAGVVADAALRRWLHPGLAPRLAPRDPLRAELARELAPAKTALDAALRLTRWAASAARRAGRTPAELLVAALRSAGLPARLAYGLLYAGSVATEHQWAEVHLGLWLPLDPEAGGVASAAHLRLAVSPAGPLPTPTPSASATASGVLTREPNADWRQLRHRLQGVRVRLLEAQLASGFRYVPGGRLNTQVTANVLQHRVWNLVVRRPLATPATRFVLPGPRDDFELQVAGTKGDLRLTLRLYAANAEGLDARAFLARRFLTRRIGAGTWLVKTTVGTGASAGLLRRTYVQFACSPGPWAARLVRFSLEARGVSAAHLSALEAKVLGTFQMPGRPALAASCPRPGPPRRRAVTAPPLRRAPRPPTKPLR